jgi:hypothetical protein
LDARRTTGEDDDSNAKRERLKTELKRLLRQGLSQYEVAQKVGVPPQYLSDVKNGRRAVTELFARRLAERLGVDYQWLVRGRCVKVSPADRNAPHTGTTSGVLVPVLNAPCVGNPQQAPAWDGSFVELAGPAAVAGRSATKPYALRLPAGAKGIHLPNGGLLLASQGVNPGRKIAIVKVGESLCLAQRNGKADNRWLAVLTGELLEGPVLVVGGIVGVIWAAM